MNPVISVAMATYNGEKYIKEQLSSILSQTLPVDEIVICDDRSSDRTSDVVYDYIKNNDLEKIISFEVNETNLGYASNFMKALLKTKGDYIFFCDQDDIWTDSRVEDMIRIMEKYPEIGLLGSEFEPFKCSEDAPDVPRWELDRFRNDGSLEKLSFNSENIFIGCQGCTMLVRRSLIEEIKGYWYEGWAHDEFVWKMALSRDELYFYHKVTLKRRLHSSNVTLHKEHQNAQRLKYLTDLEKSHKATRDYIKGADGIGNRNEKMALLNKHIKATLMRIELIRNRKLFNSIRLLGYMDCYHKKRSIPVELMMALRK